MLSEQRERVIRLPEVIQTTGLSRSQIYKLQGEGRFPRCIKINGISGWVDSEVQAFIRKAIARRNG